MKNICMSDELRDFIIVVIYCVFDRNYVIFNGLDQFL